ncbi:hypothetical protein BJ994_000661 [Arthrobacter pigmenti]|uniref:Uncharacterized protein n=1 Tax=Arthrobacter pigmenti TaxID=271432 RepID=A0A846RP84_9MICC|nr:hypothetical protein [Arthrobacter pigmenti]
MTPPRMSRINPMTVGDSDGFGFAMILQRE